MGTIPSQEGPSLIGGAAQRLRFVGTRQRLFPVARAQSIVLPNYCFSFWRRCCIRNAPLTYSASHCNPRLDGKNPWRGGRGQPYKIHLECARSGQLICCDARKPRLEFAEAGVSCDQPGQLPRWFLPADVIMQNPLPLHGGMSASKRGNLIQGRM
jgi:hypothetical protein